MPPTVSIRHQTCPNTACTYFGQASYSNVKVHSRKFRRLQCKGCKATWVEHRGQPVYRLRHNIDRLHSALQALREGASIRKVADTLQISPSTVQRWKRTKHTFAF